MNFSSIFILTQSSFPIIGTIAKVFGLIMNAIYNFFFNSFGVVSIGISIIVFTIIVRLLMIPLAIKQQKSMKDMQKVQPELKKIQEKYKNKKDPESQKKLQEESAKLYQEHNVSPLGGCLPLMIQMPILFALFAVLRNIPAYIGHVRVVYENVVNNIIAVPGYEKIIDAVHGAQKIKVKGFVATDQNKIIDLLNGLSSSGWVDLTNSFAIISDKLTPLMEQITKMHYFLGINLADRPVNFTNGIDGILTPGLLIPILCFIAQVLVTKTTSSPSSSGNKQTDQTQKTMMIMMPFITLMFVFQMPAGLGLYWLISNIFQVVQQVVVNKHLEEKI
ncbi:MAG: hypothetical protein CVU84_12910 [Firmicutes bacterium HGW-Firmicutes-1]|jgi:YidC/Oxa1 family membrane protein insertase|nr:MAG: hypothetical protein CVU84_12910 [Firmicutes bacterium HGW-Firmicutes-1]